MAWTTARMNNAAGMPEGGSIGHAARVPLWRATGVANSAGMTRPCMRQRATNCRIQDNRSRRHSALGYSSPDLFLQNWISSMRISNLRLPRSGPLQAEIRWAHQTFRMCDRTAESAQQ